MSKKSTKKATTIKKNVKKAVKNSCILIISDMHAPYGHQDTIPFLKEIKRVYKPDRVVCVGDDLRSGDPVCIRVQAHSNVVVGCLLPVPGPRPSRRVAHGIRCRQFRRSENGLIRLGHVLRHLHLPLGRCRARGESAECEPQEPRGADAEPSRRNAYFWYRVHRFPGPSDE